MNPKEKASMLIIELMKVGAGITSIQAKQFAITSCNHLINEHTLQEPLSFNVERHNYWVKVLNELNNLKL